MKLKFFLLLAIAIFCFVGCSNKPTNNFANDPLIIPPINREGILRSINQSLVSDMGYRFANLTFENQVSSYATHYIRQAKKASGTHLHALTTEDNEYIVDKFLNVSELDLTDVYCALLLLDDDYEVPEKTKDNVGTYINSLYNKDFGCYVLNNAYNGSPYLLNVYPTYTAYFVADILDIDIKPVDAWLEQAIQNIFSTDFIIKSNSSSYVLLFELAKEHDMEISTEAIENIISMFEDSFNELQTMDDIYIPVYLMDYLDFCNLSNIDSSENWDYIINLLCDKKGVKDNIFTTNDVFGLYSTMRALEMAQYDFVKQPSFDDIYHDFDSFMLDEIFYISPGQVESNFATTYYVYSIMNILNIESNGSISEYYKNNKDEILQSNTVDISNFLELLEQNNLLVIIEDDRENINNTLLSTFGTIISDDELMKTRLQTINATIKGLKLLDETWVVQNETVDNIISNFQINDQIQEKVYNLSSIVSFINLTSHKNKKDLQNEYCKRLEEALIELSTSSLTNKTMLQSMALKACKEANYDLSNDLKFYISKTLTESQDIIGLYKSGNTDQDRISFQDTFYAISTTEYLNKLN